MSDGEAAASADRDGEDEDDERTGSMSKKLKSRRVTADDAKSTADVVAASEEGSDEEKTAKVFRRLLAIFQWPMSME
jgi:hypothetical protein